MTSNGEVGESEQWLQMSSWQEAQERFEKALLLEFYPNYKTTRKLAQRLKVSHNKIAMKLRQYQIGS